MKMKNRIASLALACMLVLSACQTAAPLPAPATPTPAPAPTPGLTPASLPYQDVSLSPEQRAADLLARMTPAEKIGQMTQVEKNSISPSDVTRFFIGSVLSGGGGSPANNTPDDWVSMVAGFQQAALDTRLAIPLIYGVDAVHGHNNLVGATIFPHNIGLGATRDPDLIRKIGQATAEEMLATDIAWDFAPVVAVPQDIRWGRTYEGYAENTGLVAQLGAAFLSGLQAMPAAVPGQTIRVLGTPKHFIGDGGTTWGSSKTNQYELDQGDTQVDETTLRSRFLPPYQAAIAAGAQSIMVSFSSWNGVKMHAQKHLLTDLLKGELGFKGFLVSDWQAIDQVTPDYYRAVVLSINAGVDMAMVPYDYQKFIQTVQQALNQGDIPQARIDDAVSRILTVKFKLGLFDHPYHSTSSLLSTIGSDAHRQLARQAVAESLVLLKNGAHALPLAKDAPLIFVAGDGADDIGVQSGGWTISWQGSPGAITRGTTLLQAVQSVTTGQVLYDRGGVYDAAHGLKADVGIVVLAEQPYAEGLGDSSTLSVQGADLLKRMRSQSRKLIVVIFSGRPVIITGLLPMADAWVAAWLPGSEGEGVTDVLFGDKPFVGRLPYSWPSAVDQLPFKVTGCAVSQALFPYGYGLDPKDNRPLDAPVPCP